MTLLMRDKENLEKGKIYGAISMCRDLALPEDSILQKIMEKFQLSEEEAESYLQETK